MSYSPLAAFRQFHAVSDDISNFWTENAPELIHGASALGYSHHLSTDSRSQSRNS